MRLFISAGEASGDAYGARLLSAIRERAELTQTQAVGGSRLKEAGAMMVADCSRWGALGILEAAKVGPRVMLGYRQAHTALQLGKPGLFIPIDYGFINIKLAAFARSIGWKVLYFIPPGSWRRDKQGKDLPAITDAIVTPFPWSAELLVSAGANAHWFGHPLKQMISESKSDETRRAKRIAVLPGSRAHEIQHNMPVIAATVAGLGLELEFAVAQTITAQEIERIWKDSGGAGAATFTANDTYGVLRRAQAAIVCSGTATLEAALCGCPCVVMYRGSKWMEFEYRLRKPKFDYISLPNILLGERILPERIQTEAIPSIIRNDLTPLLDPNSAARKAQLDAFDRLNEMLGPADAIDKSADLAARLVN